MESSTQWPCVPSTSRKQVPKKIRRFNGNGKCEGKTNKQKNTGCTESAETAKQQPKPDPPKPAAQAWLLRLVNSTGTDFPLKHLNLDALYDGFHSERFPHAAFLMGPSGLGSGLGVFCLPRKLRAGMLCCPKIGCRLLGFPSSSRELRISWYQLFRFCLF